MSARMAVPGKTEKEKWKSFLFVVDRSVLLFVLFGWKLFFLILLV